VITAVGHSLGGGLAQQAAYADGRIRLVFAFDPSFVTAYSDTPALSAINSRGLKIDRVYEHGEILAYARFLQRQILPASACDPQIRTVRFNLLDGVPIVQHNMAAITARLIENAGTPITWRARRHAALPNAKEADPKTGKCSVIVVRRS
jgi:pimeloyl-ACP methyl ester carboxylesterase